MPFLTGNTLAVSTKWIFLIRPPFQMYSLQQKHCTTALDEKSSVFLTVNFYEILHVSTYGNYSYIYKVKKMAAATARPPAAVRRGRSICTRAHNYSFVVL